MSKILTLEIPDEVFSSFQKQAERRGETAEKFVLEIVLKNIPPSKTNGSENARLAEERFARHFGAINSGDSTSADNEKIDADLIRAYEDTHDDE
ncbi:MAG: hypothetical protein ACR2HG_08345 [Pyrinomonadaceae bacterium]